MAQSENKLDMEAKESPSGYVEKWRAQFKAVGVVSDNLSGMPWQTFAAIALFLTMEPYLNLNLDEKNELNKSWKDFALQSIVKKASFTEFISSTARSKNKNLHNLPDPKPILSHVSPFKLLNPFKLSVTILTIVRFSLAVLIDKTFAPKNTLNQTSTIPARIAKAILVSPLTLLSAIIRPLADLDYILAPEPAKANRINGSSPDKNKQEKTPTQDNVNNSSKPQNEQGRNTSFISTQFSSSNKLQDSTQFSQTTSSSKAPPPPITLQEEDIQLKPDATSVIGSPVTSHIDSEQTSHSNSL